MAGWALPARADSLFVSLDYEVDGGSRNCPTEADVRHAVSTQLGYDPFRLDAPRRVVAQVQSSQRGLEGLIVWKDQANNREGERRFPSSTRDCGELVKGMAFAIAVQIQLLSEAGRDDPPPPLSSSSPPPQKAPPAEEKPKPMAPEEKPKPPDETPHPPNRFIAVGVGAEAGFGLAPSVSSGGRVFVAGRLNPISIELAIDGRLPVRLVQPDNTGFTAQTVGATLAPCGHLGHFAACPVVRVGRLRVSGFGVDDGRSPSSTLVWAGGRLLWFEPLSDRFAIGIHVDGLGLLTPRTVYLNDLPAWTATGIVSNAGFDVAVLFR